MKVHIVMISGVRKPSKATFTASRLDEMHSGKNKLNPKNLDK